jgi:hypothetical protein
MALPWRMYNTELLPVTHSFVPPSQGWASQGWHTASMQREQRGMGRTCQRNMRCMACAMPKHSVQLTPPLTRAIACSKTNTAAARQRHGSGTAAALIPGYFGLRSTSTTLSPLKNILEMKRSWLTGRLAFLPLPVLGICKRIHTERTPAPGLQIRATAGVRRSHLETFSAKRPCNVGG